MGNAGIIGMGVPQEVVKFSGVTITLASGSLSVSVSGQTVVVVSGTISVNVSGNVVKISGETIRFGGIVSTANSTTALLGSGGVFTGTSESLLNVGTIQIFVDSDVGTSLSGLVLQYSPDQANWAVEEFFFNSGLAEDVTQILTQPKGQYMRIVYTNTPTAAQTRFDLQTIYYPTAFYPFSRPLYNVLRWDDPSVITRAVLEAFNDIDIGSGIITTVRVLATSGGAAHVTEASSQFRYVAINAAMLSGGTRFASGATNEIFFQNVGSSPQGPVFISSTPYSGTGIVLQSGQTIGPIKLNNTGLMAAYGTISGTLVTAFGGGSV